MPVTKSAFDDPWRVQCPEGHTGLRPLEAADMAYCQRCRWSYGFERLIDRKEQERGRAVE